MRPRVFEDTVLPHLDAAFNYVRWLTRNDADAEEVVQDACVRAMRFFRRCEPTTRAPGCSRSCGIRGTAGSRAQAPHFRSRNGSTPVNVGLGAQPAAPNPGLALKARKGT